jgi:hypothetical protein
MLLTVQVCLCAYYSNRRVADDYNIVIVVLPREYIDKLATRGANNSGLDLTGNRQSMGAEPGASFEGHSTSRAPTYGVDLKHRTNTLLSPVHEVLTPVTSVTGTPRPNFSSLGTEK